jgi:mono/diheme cytochrome c family protein
MLAEGHIHFETPLVNMAFGQTIARVSLPGALPQATVDMADGHQLKSYAWRLGVFAIGLLTLIGCHTDMYDQPRYEALEKSDFFKDGRASRPLVAGTVQYQAPPADDVMHTGKQNGQLATELPMTLTPALLERGHERFNIYCSVCHGRTGAGDGMIVQRGYRQPPTYHSDRLRGAPIGHFFDVMTNGFGAMPSYSLQVPVEDRWAIAAYIRALQLSQYASADQIPDDVKQQLNMSSPQMTPMSADRNAEGSPP